MWCRHWTETGRETVNDMGGRERVSDAVDAVDWQRVPCSMGMMQGMAIKEMIRVLNLPAVDAVGDSPALAPFGVIGVQANYRKNGRTRVYAVDLGTECVVVCWEHEKPQTERKVQA